MEESVLRKLIVERVRGQYPHRDLTYDRFLAGEKVTIDSWLGDAFAVALHGCGESTNYEQWRAKLFVD